MLYPSEEEKYLTMQNLLFKEQKEELLNLLKDMPVGYTFGEVAFTISLALTLQAVSATLIGASLPIVVRKLGGDPAVAASPAITTAVDITGLLIYFGVATALLL
jgi:magnesium transporter